MDQKVNIAALVDKEVAHEIWEIEICDLGACKPFLGYALSDQYILVGITDPNKQNEVTITSIPEGKPKAIFIPLVLSNFECEDIRKIRFKGLKRISATWNVRFFDKKEQVGYKITEEEIFSTSLIKEQQVDLTGSSQYRFISSTHQSPRFEVILTEKL